MRIIRISINGHANYASLVVGSFVSFADFVFRVCCHHQRSTLLSLFPETPLQAPVYSTSCIQRMPYKSLELTVTLYSVPYTVFSDRAVIPLLFETIEALHSAVRSFD
jgi:hypothetical protein